MSNDTTSTILPIALLIGGAAVAFYVVTRPQQQAQGPVDQIVGTVTAVGGLVGSALAPITKPITNVLGAGAGTVSTVLATPGRAINAGGTVIGDAYGASKTVLRDAYSGGKSILAKANPLNWF